MDESIINVHKVDNFIDVSKVDGFNNTSIKWTSSSVHRVDEFISPQSERVQYNKSI